MAALRAAGQGALRFAAGPATHAETARACCVLLLPQAQGHESATQPPLDNYVPDYGGSGLLGNEELPAWQDLRQQQQPAATAAGAAGGWGAPPPMQQQQQQATTFAQVQQQQQGLGSGLPPLQGGPGAQVMVAQQVVMGADGEAHLARAGGAGAGVGAAGDDDDDEEGDDLLGAEEPPGLFDYDAGACVRECCAGCGRRACAPPSALCALQASALHATRPQLAAMHACPQTPCAQAWRLPRLRRCQRAH
jgi:hypothetical protein